MSTWSSGTRRTPRTSPRSATPDRSISTPTAPTARLLHRIDLGVNIRAGAHYTQFMVYDFDGDGRSEMMLKTAPGHQDDPLQPVRRRDVGALHHHAAPGPARRLPAHRRLPAERGRLLRAPREDVPGLATHPEVVAGNWPATIEEAFGIAPRYDYPLSQADAEALADYFIDVYAPSRSIAQRAAGLRGLHRRRPGVPHRLRRRAPVASCRPSTTSPAGATTVCCGATTRYPRIEPGNRVDRFLAGVAYLDGKRPSAVFARGYYTRATLVAYDWDGRRLQERWYVDSGHVPMTNPFNDTPARPRRHRPGVREISPRRASTPSAPPTSTATASTRSSTAPRPSTTTATCSTARSPPCRRAAPAPAPMPGSATATPCT